MSFDSGTFNLLRGFSVFDLLSTPGVKAKLVKPRLE